MSDKDEEELSDDELDSLIADLEEKSQQGDVEPSDISTENLEDELGDISVDEPPEPTEPDAAPSEPAPSSSDSEPKEVASSSADKSDAESSDPSGPPVVERRLKPSITNTFKVAKIVVGSATVASAFWLFGSLIAEWITAGWLIAAFSLLVIGGASTATRLGVKKLSFGTWLSLWSLLVGVILVLPLASTSIDRLAEHGHWPATTAVSLTGGAPTHSLVRANNRFARETARLWSGEGEKTDLPPPKKLGSDQLLFAPAGDDGN
jgi:hypothetical protein